MRGDENGLNIGRVFTYNKMQFILGSKIPFEQYCYFKFVFPERLTIDTELTQIEGNGMFQPSTFSDILPENYYSIDLDANTVYV